MLKAILFDMDGVIIDSEPLHAAAAVNALKKFGVTTTAKFCYSFIGSTAKHMLEVAKEKWGLSAPVEELMRANEEAKKELLRQEGYPAIPGILPLMESLNHEGYQIAIASSSPLEEIFDTVNRQHLNGLVHKIISGMQVAHPKPAPDIFLTAAKELGVLPDECLVIEDSTNGLNAAKAAGMARLAFRNPNSGNQDLSAANYIVEGFDEVTPDFLYYVYQHAHRLPAVITTTSRLILRELFPQDMPALYKILSEPSTAQYCGEPVRTLEELTSLSEAYIPAAYHFRGFGLWGIFLKSTGELIGRCGFETTPCDNSTGIELGYLISENFRNHGYAHEAASACLSLCQRFGFSTVFCVVRLDNPSSLHLSKKLGMRMENEILRNGNPCVVFRFDVP
ncbi:MAG: GNAT family N-acetyltransferase [Lachnospiraceae bacterium]|nr:GNAT family N-acetyltransferase [Lachnospiraceae bacterium]